MIGTAFEITTEATVHYDGRQVDAGRASWMIGPDDLAAGRYMLESARDAAARIARHWHLDRLEATHRSGTIEVDTISVAPVGDAR